MAERITDQDVEDLLDGCELTNEQVLSLKFAGTVRADMFTEESTMDDEADMPEYDFVTVDPEVAKLLRADGEDAGEPRGIDAPTLYMMLVTRDGAWQQRSV